MATIYQTVTQYVQLPIDVYVIDPLVDSTVLPINVEVNEPILAIEPLEIQVGTTAELTPIELNLTETIKSLALQLVGDKIKNAFDTDIELKLLLNFGNDLQQIILAKDYYSGSNKKIKLKLIDPLFAQFEEGDELWLSREVASSVLDMINLLPAPLIDTTPYLRPKNTNIKFMNLSGKNLRNVTWSSLNLNTDGTLIGSAPSASWNYEDDVMRRWYTDDWKTSELNIDFTDYSNFVVYGLAEKRITAFVNKLERIEYLTSQSYSVESTASLGTAQNKSLQIETIIRSFDPYETFLYFETGIPYSASTPYAGTEYNTDSTWPKISGSNVSPYSVEASDWLDIQLPIALRYDEYNQNSLVSNLPGHILDDDENTDFWDFVSMIGHYFDNIKPYVDASKYIYNRSPDVDDKLSKDLVWQVAYSFGTELPNKSALDSLSRYLFGENNSLAGRKFTSEIWKRILHSYVYLTKMKGTRAAIRSIIHSFGITSQQLPIRETARTVSSSVYYSDEATYAAQFNPDAFIIIPWSSSIRDNYAIELRFNATDNATTTLFNADSDWKLELVPHPTITTYSRLEVRDNVDTTIISSSYDTFTDGTYYNVVLQKNDTIIELDVRQTDGTRVLVSSLDSAPTSSLSWETPQYLYLGGSGSISTNTFSGSVDEFRVWGITLDEDTKTEHAYNPGSHTGNEISDAYNYLYVMLSFNKPEDIAGSFGLVTNETPYFNVDGISKPFDILRTNLTVFQTLGFATAATYPYQTKIITRTSRYRTITGGSLLYSSNKVRIAEPPPTGSDYTVLSPKRSIVPITDKREETVGSNVVGIFMSPTDVVNQMIYRAFGYFELDDYIGYPGDRTKTKYTSLALIQNIFANQYFKGYNVGEFVRFFDGFTNSIFEYIVEFIPAKAILAKGIVIEPSVLERSKQTIIQPLRIDGTGTRNTETNALNTMYTMESTISADEDIQISSDLQDYLAELNIEIDTVQSEYNVHDAFITASVEDPITAEYTQYESVIDAFAVDKFGATYVYYENVLAIDESLTIVPSYEYYEVSQSLDMEVGTDFAFSNFEADIDLASFYSQSRVEYEFANSNPSFYEIPPSTDLNDSGVTTYFYQKDGIYNWINYVKRPITSSIMRSPVVATTWTAGNFYTRGDVVQQVGLVDVYGNRLTGNNKYYVFITEEQISGSTQVKFQSFNPPQYDKQHWEPVQHITRAYNGRKRIIYINPTQEQLLTGTQQLSWVELDKIASDTGLRKTFSSDEIELPGSTATQGLLRLEKGFIILSLQSSQDNYRLRLYGNPESRDIDNGRAFGVEPDETVNVILDIILETGTKNVEIRLNPPVTGMIDNEILQNFVYYTLDNLDGTTKNLQMIFNLFILEGVLKVPKEYLARHYKFFRDNSTGTKRRNYLGTQQTQDTTPDSKPPVEIFSSEGNTLTVQPGSNTIGGNEILNVI